MHYRDEINDILHDSSRVTGNRDGILQRIYHSLFNFNELHREVTGIPFVEILKIPYYLLLNAFGKLNVPHKNEKESQRREDYENDFLEGIS